MGRAPSGVPALFFWTLQPPSSFLVFLVYFVSLVSFVRIDL